MFKFIARLFAILLLLVMIAAAFFFWKLVTPLHFADKEVELQIGPGSSLRTITVQINKAGIEIDPRLFSLLGKLQRVEKKLKAGNYEITSGITAFDLINKITNGDVTQTDIVFIEGWTFRQMRERIDNHPNLRHDTAGLSDAEIMKRLGADGKPAEGMFFPDTYLFAKQSSDLDVLARAYRIMQQHLNDEWNNREEGLPYTSPYEALTMASIVEKETGRDQDRPLVAAVFVNRLRLGMLLQTDPTVIYGLGEGFDGNLRKRDLVSDTPYNTYTRAGLTPTPIALPGLASLRAALHPAKSDALYFVAKGDGASHFSKNLNEHNQAVNRYQRGGK